MLTKTLDPEQLKQAEQSAECKYGPEWRSQRLDYYFGPIIEYPHETALSRKSYLLQAAPQQEANVVKALQDAGLDAYLPVEPKSIKVGHIKRQIIKRPMLPGYVFPIFDVARDNWQIIRKPDKEGRAGIEGVLRLFLWGERPVPIADDEIQRIRNAETEKNLGKRRKLPAVPLKIGSLVQIIEHRAFGGWIGTVIETLAEKWETIVELDIFSQKTPVTLSVESVKVID
jgi:transcription antitermination factor NusG